jgi:hypothetical protein
MDDNDVTQSKNTVAGDQSGRDVNKTWNYFLESQDSISTMSRLLRQFEDERRGNVRLNEIIEELDHYHSRLEGDVIGLEQKLRDGDYETLIRFALIAKERFRKKLEKYQFSEAAQKINVHLLGRVWSNFENKIAPKIKIGIPADEIGGLIQKTIVDQVSSELLENPLDFTDIEINGMLYFLTGNCHIMWKK